MADDSNRIGSSGISNASVDLLKQALGVGVTPSGANGGVDSSSAGGGTRGAVAGARGSRILPADYPLDQLDRRAARGTYLDILV